MNAVDLIQVLVEYAELNPDINLIINGPRGQRLAITKIESKPDGLHVDTGYWSLPNNEEA